MSPTKSIISKALQLKPAERFIVIEALIKSLDMPDPQIEKTWALEAEKRLKAYRGGEAENGVLRRYLWQRGMKIRILEIARLEFEAAKDFYEMEQAGLGARFENEIKKSLLRFQ